MKIFYISTHLKYPSVVTLTKVGKHHMVDSTSAKELQMSSALSFSINRHGDISGLTKKGGASIDRSIILDMISAAKQVSNQLITRLDSDIRAAETSASES